MLLNVVPESVPLLLSHVALVSEKFAATVSLALKSVAGKTFLSYVSPSLRRTVAAGQMLALLVPPPLVANVNVESVVSGEGTVTFLTIKRPQLVTVKLAGPTRSSIAA